MEDWLGADGVDIEDSISDQRTERRSKVKTALSGIEEAMNIPTGSTPIPKGLAKVVKKNTEVAIQAAREVLSDPEESFEDKEFIREIIKTQIIKMQSTLEIMEGNFMVGSEPRMFEVYSDLNKSVLDGCTKLMALQKQSDNAKMMKAPPADEITVTETKQIKAKGSDMSAFLEQLRSNGAIT
jgi:hypothetical protein